MTQRVAEAFLQDIDLVVHEIQIQEFALRKVCETIELCKILVLRQNQTLFDGAAVQLDSLQIGKNHAVSGQPP